MTKNERHKIIKKKSKLDIQTLVKEWAVTTKNNLERIWFFSLVNEREKKKKRKNHTTFLTSLHSKDELADRSITL